jgi:four helix bundle protein
MLSFQRLDVYQRATEFLSLSIDIVERLPKGNRARAEQLSNSAESVVRNIAEGAGRWTGKDSAKHYKIARGEAMESVASLDVLRMRRLISDAHYERGVELMHAVVSMLTKMF